MKATTCVMLVTCITKTEHSSPYQRISHIGGHGWKFTQEQAVQGILNEQYIFYVLKGDKAVELTVGLYEDIVYLKTAADGARPNHLLRLPECVDEPIAILQKVPAYDEALAPLSRFKRNRCRSRIF
jgi:Protein of unknown function (DUF3892)